MAERLSTGNAILDRRLSGGVPPGKLVVLSAPSDSQSELLLSAWANAGPSLYLSTARPVSALKPDLDELGVDLDTTTLIHRSPADLATDPGATFSQIPDDGYFVLDAGDGIEQLSRQQQLTILNELSDELRERDSVGLVRCSSESPPAGRSLTLTRADLVWRLHLTMTSLSIETRLLVTKFRGGAAHTEPIKLLLTDRVSVDTSRDIA